MSVLRHFHDLPAIVEVIKFRLVLLGWTFEERESKLLDESKLIFLLGEMFLDTHDHRCGRTGNDLAWEVAHNRLQEDGLFALALFVQVKDLSEDLLGRSRGKTLEKPVDGGFEQAEVLLVGSALVIAFFDGLGGDLEGELGQDHEVVLGFGVDGVANSCKIGCRVASADGFGDAPHHLGKSEQVRLLHSSLHELMAGYEGQLKVDSWQDFPDTG